MKTSKCGPVSTSLKAMSVQCLWVMIARALRALDGDEAVSKGGLWLPAVEQLLRGLTPELTERERVRSYANRTPSSGLGSAFDIATERYQITLAPAAEVFLVDYTLRLLEAVLQDLAAFQALIDWFHADVEFRRKQALASARRVHEMLSDEVVPERGEFIGDS